MNYLKAFALGAWEFKHGTTTHFDPPLIEWYDTGRELAHIITLRLFEP